MVKRNAWRLQSGDQYYQIVVHLLSAVITNAREIFGGALSR